MIVGGEYFATRKLGDVNTGLLTNKSACEVVPHAVAVKVDPTIEHALCDQTNIKSGRTECTKLRLLWPEGCEARHAYNRLFQCCARRWLQLFPVVE